MQTQWRFMAVDLGASGGKCFAGELLDGEFSLRELHRFDHECVSFAISDREGTATERMYWDDTLIYANILQGLQAARREIGPRLDGIGIDTWGADGALISADGDMLGKVYAYRDHRLDRMSDRVRDRLPAERIYGITGIHFQPFNVSNQLLWLTENRPQLLKLVHRFLPAPTLFYYFLGGITVVDSTWASVTQLMDAHTRHWSAEILAALDIPAAIMPEIVPPGTRVGQLNQLITERVGLDSPPDLLTVGGHDTASAFAAAPVRDPLRALIISSGTWSLVGRLVPEPVTTPAAMAANLSNEGGIGNVRLLKNCMGGWLAHELRRIWRAQDGQEMAWDEMYRQAQAAPAFTALIDPDDQSFYNPADMEQALLEYCRRTGQTAPQGRGGLLRMVYESLALKYRRISADLAESCGEPPATVHIVGGGARNEMLNQFTANALNLPVEAGPIEATAIGNLMVQAVGAGAVQDLSQIIPAVRQAFPVVVCRPQPDQIAAWQAAYDRFQTICG
ncbi:MAG: rhamnulokinase [Lentisphaerae bacterium]|nr:rhamnulokinase [Lentisphaerota bacterium]